MNKEEEYKILRELGIKSRWNVKTDPIEDFKNAINIVRENSIKQYYMPVKCIFCGWFGNTKDSNFTFVCPECGKTLIIF